MEINKKHKIENSGSGILSLFILGIESLREVPHYTWIAITSPYTYLIMSIIVCIAVLICLLKYVFPML